MGDDDQAPRKDVARRSGRDEMNLAEFPITLLADRAPQGQKTLVFRDGEQTLTVTGSDKFGLPTAIDADVIVALLSLTKEANNFTNPTVPFTRYGLLRTLGWPNKGSSYQRLTRSLKCWTGVLLNYEKAWWDNKAKRKVDATFHIIESVEFHESSLFDDEHLASTFTWSKRFFESCRDDNLKRLDLDLYFSLDSSVARRMYRFLDKRLYKRDSCTFDLHEFAYEHVGLGRNYSDNGKLKEKLAPALKELEAIDYLQPMDRDERYKQVKRGHWTITLARKPEGEILGDDGHSKAAAATGLERELVARGVAASQAKSLLGKYPAERIERQLEHVGFIQTKHPSAIRHLAGFLRKAIEEDYAAPPGFVAKAELARREERARATSRVQAAERRRRSEEDAREQDAKALVAGHLAALTAAEIDELDREILSNPEHRESYEKQFPRFKPLYLELLRRAFVRVRLGLPTEP